MFFDYQKQITALEAEFNSKVTEFINQYDKLVIQAQMKLGTLFDASDYPNAEDIASKYRFSVKYTPVPDVGDWRVNVGNEAQQLLKDSYAKAYTTNLTQAYADVWQRTYDALSNMSNKLSGNDKQIFRDSLVSNVRDMVALLDRFNITNDDKMRLAKVKIENALLGVTPDALREDDDFRLDTKTKVDALLKEFSW
jgi:hypothetical protein